MPLYLHPPQLIFNGMCVLDPLKNRHFSHNSDMQEKKIVRLRNCFGPKGVCEINVIKQRETYSHSETVIFSVAIDNSQSNIDVLGIRYRFYYKTRLPYLNANFTPFFFQETLCESLFQVRILAYSSSLTENLVDLEINLPSFKDKMENIYSTKGKILECIFMVDVHAVMDASCLCCGEVPTVETVINIVPDNFEPERTINLPVEWNPRVFERVSIQFLDQ